MLKELTFGNPIAMPFFIFQLVGLGTAALGVYFILDEERIQMHQIVLVNVKDIKEMAASEAQPMLYFLTLAIVGSGILMTLSSLWNFVASSKDNPCFHAMVCYLVQQQFTQLKNFVKSIFFFFNILGCLYSHNFICVSINLGIFWSHFSSQSPRRPQNGTGNETAKKLQ